MARPPEPLFLERQTYRVRRLGDAAKLLPILGGVLFLLPILWFDSARTAGGIVYLFIVWAGLIVIVALLSRALAAAEHRSDEAAGDQKAER